MLFSKIFEVVEQAKLIFGGAAKVMDEFKIEDSSSINITLSYMSTNLFAVSK